MASVAEPPSYKTAAQEFRDGESVEQPYVRQREHKRGYPEVGVSVRVFIAPQVDLLSHSHDVGILSVLVDARIVPITASTLGMSYVEQNLVEEVQRVAAT